MYCGKCGAEIKENQKFCGGCGAEILDAAFAVKEEENRFNAVADIDLPSPKKKRKVKIIIPIISVLVAVSLIAGTVLVALKDSNKWCCVETKTVFYKQNKIEKSNILSQRTDGQITSETNMNEDDELTYGQKYAYDDEGRAIRISFYNDGENIGVIRLDYEKENGNYIAETTEIIDDEKVTAKRIYNKKNILIYESLEIGEEDSLSITEKEYNDKGQALKTHNRYRVFADIYNDYIGEYRYEDNRLKSISFYNDNELESYQEYDKNGNIIKSESYDDGELDEQIIYDWSKSKIKGTQSSLYGIGGEVKCYNADQELLYEMKSEFVDDTVEVYWEIYDDEMRKEYEEEYENLNKNEPFITAALNDKKLVKDISVNGEKAYEYKYDKNGNVISTKYYSDGELYQTVEYKWSKR